MPSGSGAAGSRNRMPIRCMPPGKDGLGREIATPNDARERLQLKGANKVVF